MKKTGGVSVIGYKKSGKTSLIIELIRVLKSRGIGRIAVLKHSGCELEVSEENDTGRFYPLADRVIGSFKGSSLVFDKGEFDYTALINGLDCDFLIVEGYKQMGNLPRILCLNENGDRQKLANGLEVALFSQHLSGEGIWGPDDIQKIADRVLKKAFVLPNHNCKKCGEDSCRAFAKKILAGEADLSGCEYLEDETGITLEVDGDRVRMKSFVAVALKETIAGFLKSLKGAEGERVEIKFRNRDS